MTLSDIAQWVAVVLVAAGLVRVIYNNGRSQKQRDKAATKILTERAQEITDALRDIVKRLDDSDSGLSALNKHIHSLEINMSRYEERLKIVEYEVKDLRRNMFK